VCGAVEEIFKEETPWWYCNRIGLILYATGKYDQAFDYFQRCLTMLPEMTESSDEELKNRSASLNNISNIYKVWGDYDQAIKYENQAWFICNQIGDIAGEGEVFLNIGTTYYAKGEYENAVKFLEKSLAFFDFVDQWLVEKGKGVET